MALTPFRWIAMAAIGCMLAIVGLVSVAESSGRRFDYGPPPRSITDTTELRLSEIAGGWNQAAQNLATRYQLLHVLDSARRSAMRSPDTGSVRLFVSDAFRPDVRLAIERTVLKAKNARSGGAGRVDLFIIHDAARSIRGVTTYAGPTEVRYALPERPGDRCRVYVRWFRGGGPDLADVMQGEKTAQQLLGPCGYYLAFGEPGPLVKQWLLESGAWQYTVEGSWTTASVIPEVRQDSSIFKGGSPALFLLNVEGGGPACIKGDLDACERLVVTRPTGRQFRQIRQVGGATGAFQLSRRRYYAGAIGSQAGELLADAVREMGRERYKAFWTSADSVPAAYEKASGERFGTFINRWMIAHYGEIHPGPRMTGYSLIVSTILVLLALGATMMISVRRTYT